MLNCVAVPNLVEIGQNTAEIWRSFDFSSWRPPPSWIFQISNFNGRTAEEGRTASLCQICYKIGQNAAEIWRFFNFTRWRPAPSWIFQIFNGRNAEEGRTASPCQIWSKSVKTRPRYGDFSIFQDGGRRHLGFLKFKTFNGRTAEEGRTASLCQIWSKSVKTRP